MEELLQAAPHMMQECKVEGNVLQGRLKEKQKAA